MTLSALIQQLQALKAQHGDTLVADARNRRLFSLATTATAFIGDNHARQAPLDDEPRALVVLLG